MTMLRWLLGVFSLKKNINHKKSVSATIPQTEYDEKLVSTSVDSVLHDSVANPAVFIGN